ncbi:MAG: hypothetical protein F6K21_36710 [Symploca sp. SIO2D2]|nr:hypothetical protein [Symploca sp. SIO2D2]NER20741.1 hypothetical protein [Symploca sp. SIO1C2]NER48382.1 hypothetical protein [Symploca sp. SIO1A3]
MDILAEKLNTKLQEWQPDTVEEVRQLITEIISLADQGNLDILRSRRVEQEVLDLLDEPETW